MLSASETVTFFGRLEGTSVRWIDTRGNVLAGLHSEQIAERQVRRDNSALWILRNGYTNRKDLHDRLKLGHSLLELSIEIANLLLGFDLSAYIGVGAEPSHQIPLRVADRYGASEKPAILPFSAS